jgi:hypothetical protein
MNQLTTEQINEKAEQIAKELGVKVYPLSFKDKEGNQIIGFIREPNRATKMVALDKMFMQSPTLAGETVLDTSLIKEHSDPRITEDDSCFLGAVTFCIGLIEAYQNEVKKK